MRKRRRRTLRNPKRRLRQTPLSLIKSLKIQMRTKMMKRTKMRMKKSMTKIMKVIMILVKMRMN
jgi:hypothetical protein